MTSRDYIFELTNNMKPVYAFREDVCFEEWQKEARAKLKELIGHPLQKCPYEFQIIEEEMCEEYKKITFIFQSEPRYYVPCTLLVPLEADKPKPGVICLQGHTSGAHISLGIACFRDDEKQIKECGEDFAVRAVKEGFCAIALEQRYMGEKGRDKDGLDTACYVFNGNGAMNALMIGRTAIGERVWDVQCLIDVMEEYLTEYIDTKQILCIGNSGGGTATFYAACCDERIRMAIPSCSVCEYEESIMAMFHCPCNYIPGIRKYFRMGDLGSLIAPRNLIVVCGTEDKIFPLPGVEISYGIIEETYKRIGKEQMCRLVKGNGGHKFYPEETWPVIREMVEAW